MLESGKALPRVNQTESGARQLIDMKYHKFRSRALKISGLVLILDFLFLSFIDWYYNPNDYELIVPKVLFGLVVGVPALVIFIPLVVLQGIEAWPWKFSLRTLLIATTLIAVGLGTIVWLIR
jgi:hypothetical protein